MPRKPGLRLMWVASATLAAVLCVDRLPVIAQAAPGVTYEVYAIRFGTLPQFAVSGLVAGADRSRRLDIPVMVWLLKGSNGKRGSRRCGPQGKHATGETQGNTAETQEKYRRPWGHEGTRLNTEDSSEERQTIQPRPGGTAQPSCRRAAVPDGCCS